LQALALASSGLAHAQAAAPEGDSGTGAVAPGVTALAGTLESLLRAEVARPGGLVADEAARRASASSHDARARGADAEAARAEIDRANLGWYPRATLTARYTRLSDIDPPAFGPPGASLVATSDPPGPLAPGAPLVALDGSALSFPVVLDQAVGQAGIVVPISDYFLRVSPSRDAAEHARDAAELGTAAARRDAATQARLAYYAWARARLQGVVTHQAIEQARQHLALIEAARDGGRANPADVLRAQSALANTELLDERAQNAARLAEARLRTLMHDTRGVTFAIGEDLFAPADGGADADSERLHDAARRQRPELRAIEASGASVDEQRAATRAAEWPRLDAFANGYLANPSPRVFPQDAEWKATWDVGLQLTWSPNDLAGASPQQRTLDARRARLAAERDAVSDAIGDEITAAVLATREALAAVAPAERGLAAAEEAHRVRRELYGLGRGTSVELLDAETNLLRARLDLIQARIDARVARVRLAHAVGE
jgi:outer membrane protein TolC